MPLRNAHLRLAAELEGLQLRYRQQLAVIRARKSLIWIGAFLLLTAVEVAIAFPLLMGPSRQAVESVDRATQAIVSSATGDDSSPRAGAAADRGRDVLRKGPAGSPPPEKRPGPAALAVAGGEEALSDEDTAEASEQAVEPSNTESSTTESDRSERSAPTRRSAPVNDGSADPKDDSPAVSPPPPTPPAPPAAKAQTPPPAPPPPPPTTSTTTTTRTVALPPPDNRSNRGRRRDDDEDEDEDKDTTTTTTTTTASPPPPPPTTTTPDDEEDEEDEEDRKRRRGGGGDDEDGED